MNTAQELEDLPEFAAIRAVSPDYGQFGTYVKCEADGWSDRAGDPARVWWGVGDDRPSTSQMLIDCHPEGLVRLYVATSET